MPTTSPDVVISDDEYILRALGSDDITSSDVIRWQALAPKVGTRVISVMRASLMTPEEAKTQGREVKKVKFAGFARAQAGVIAGIAEDIYDKRDEYMGHAHVDHGFDRPPQDDLAPGEVAPVDSEYLAALRYFRQLAAVFCYFVDHTKVHDWQGPPLLEICASDGEPVPCAHRVPELAA